MKLLQEGVERGDAGVRAFAPRGQDDAIEIARAVRDGEEAPLARAELEEAARVLVVEDDDGLAAGDVTAREDVIREARTDRERARHSRIGRLGLIRARS